MENFLSPYLAVKLRARTMPHTSFQASQLLAKCQHRPGSGICLAYALPNPLIPQFLTKVFQKFRMPNKGR